MTFCLIVLFWPPLGIFFKVSRASPIGRRFCFGGFGPVCGGRIAEAMGKGVPPGGGCDDLNAVGSSGTSLWVGSQVQDGDVGQRYGSKDKVLMELVI